MMPISRCRYWCCGQCRSVYGKKDLAEVLRRAAPAGADDLPGQIRCPKCGALHPRAEVYAGAFDVPPDRWHDLAPPVELADVAPEPGGRGGEAITAVPA